VDALPAQGSVGELRRWPERGRAEENADHALVRALPKPTKGLGAQHLEFNLHAGISCARRAARCAGALPPLLRALRLHSISFRCSKDGQDLGLSCDKMMNCPSG
jgi:hypothetical protein